LGERRYHLIWEKRGNSKSFIKEKKRGLKMKKVVLLILFCTLILPGCAGYSFYGRSCQKLDDVLLDIDHQRINPVMNFMDELFLSMMQFTSEHFSKWEE
jgi:hypothetical protein